MNPSSVWEWILVAVLFLLSLSILITLHELGHLLTAKAFNVYCREFSIGFGPALIRKRGKGKETYFALRAIPLGGYVSMYDDESASEEDEKENIPHERSLDGISRPKRAVIFSAGVIVNAILGLLIFAISNICFPYIGATNIGHVEESSIAASAGIQEKSRLFIYGQEVIDKETNEMVNPSVLYQYELNGTTYMGYMWIIDPNVTLNNGNHYVLAYYPTGTKNATKLTDGLKLFVGEEWPTDSETKYAFMENETFLKWKANDYTLPYYPDYSKGVYQLDREESYVANLYFREYLGQNEKGNDTWATNEDKVLHQLTLNVKAKDGAYAYEDVGLSFVTQNTWLPFSERIAGTFEDFGTAASAVFKGLGMLFTGGIRNMSGIVGIFQTSASIYSSYTFSMYLFFWGLISVNLAIFNLLPFPGLDGWSLLVTAIEGATNAVKRAKYKKSSAPMEDYKEWRIPPKVKGVLSFIGLALIFLLMIAVIIMDVLRIMHIL